MGIERRSNCSRIAVVITALNAVHSTGSNFRWYICDASANQNNPWWSMTELRRIYAPEKPSTSTTTLRYGWINYVNSHNNLWHFWNLFAKEVDTSMQLAQLHPLRRYQPQQRAFRCYVCAGKDVNNHNNPTLWINKLTYVNSHNNLWHFCNLFEKEIGKSMQLPHLLTPCL